MRVVFWWLVLCTAAYGQGRLRGVYLEPERTSPAFDRHWREYRLRPATPAAIPGHVSAMPEYPRPVPQSIANPFIGLEAAFWILDLPDNARTGNLIRRARRAWPRDYVRQKAWISEQLRGKHVAS